jgi:hypothetical protein
MCIRLDERKNLSLRLLCRLSLSSLLDRSPLITVYLYSNHKGGYPMSISPRIPRLCHRCPDRSVEYQKVMASGIEQVGRYGHAW